MRVSSASRMPVLLAILLAASPAFARPRPHPLAAGPHAPVLEVQDIGARAAAATDALRARVRDHVARHLRVLTEIRLLSSPRGYVVDGSIDTLDVVDGPDGLKISCAVRLIVSARGSGAMLAFATGEATLKQPSSGNARRSSATAPGDSIERLAGEALDGAVRASCDELVQHFQSRRKS